MGITAVAFDGDDTLWHNETVFSMTQERICALLADHADADALGERLYAVETRNLHLYGYGAKSFILSIIETAIEVSDGTVDTATSRRSSTSARPCSSTRSSCSTASATRWRRWRTRAATSCS